MGQQRKPSVTKRLERLVKSEICLAEDVSEYTKKLNQLVHETIDKDTVKMQSRLFKALADETRLKILKLLSIREMCVCEIMVALDLTQPTASHHLGILERVGLIMDRREGRWVFYRLSNQRFTNLTRVLMEK